MLSGKKPYLSIPMSCAARLIFNPIASQGNPEQELEQIKTLLGQTFELDIQLTTPDKDADALAREAVEQGVEVLFVSGGDGIVSAAAAAVMRTEIPGLRPLRELDQFEAEIETDDKIISLTASALTVANAAPATSVLAQGPAGLVVDEAYWI
jgi:diacylglycerol kinase family enzyme